MRATNFQFTKKWGVLITLQSDTIPEEALEGIYGLLEHEGMLEYITSIELTEVAE